MANRVDVAHTQKSRVRPDELAFRAALGEAVSKRRKALHLTGQQLSETAGVSRSLICFCENGKRSPDSDALIRLLRSLNIWLADVGIDIELKKPVTWKLPKTIDLGSISKDQFTKVFSSSIASRRKELGESQLELAEKLETTQSAVSRWEHGIESPSSMMFIRLMKVLQFDPFGIAKARR